MRMLRLLRILRFLRMFRFKRAIVLSLSLGALGATGCSPTSENSTDTATPLKAAASGIEAPAPSVHAAAVARSLTGWFTSEAQSLRDPSYFNIHLVSIPIWRERTDGHWLYVEQAAEGYLEQPYRQRIYHVTPTETGALSEIYALPDPEAWIGAWKKPSLAEGLSPSDLLVREGCAVTLVAESAGRYVGRTDVGTCLSTRQGANYATSEVVLEPNRLESWDRGFDANDEQVWGAVKGAYVFDRISDAPRP